MADNYKSQRKAREQKKDAERQQRRRDRMREAGEPGTHAVNAALFDAFAQVTLAEYRPGMKLDAMRISPDGLLVETLAILKRYYNEKQARLALRKRLRSVRKKAKRLADVS